jgi:Fe-S cluster assembly protein SufD
MTTAMERTPAEATYVDAIQSDTKPTGPKWLCEHRARARRAFTASGLPHRRIEEWKFTDLRNQLVTSYPLLAYAPPVDVEQLQKTLATSPFADVDRARAVFSDGVFRPELSDLGVGSGVEILSLAECRETAPEWVTKHLGEVMSKPDNPIAALNMAFAHHGVAICVTAKQERPLELLFLHSAESHHTVINRILIVVQDGAHADILETHIGVPGQAYLSNIVTEICIGDGAELDHVKVQMEAGEAVHLSDVNIWLGEHAKVSSFTASTGARVGRNQVFAEFGGEHSTLNVSGACMLAGKQHCDTTLEVDHAMPNCTSRELFKLVLDDTSRGIFQGKVTVRPDAQKSDGKQMAHALLLSESAEFDAKPELEIFADDVVCGHGATAGDLDEDHLYYLRARGIPEPQAKSLLVAAFIGEAFDEVANDDVRKVLATFADTWLNRHAERG